MPLKYFQEGSLEGEFVANFYKILRIVWLMKWHNPKIQPLNTLSLSKQKGFTLVELLIAFLVVTLFVSAALQGIVLASLVQIRAKDRAEASLAIQENLELIRSQATIYLQPIPGETDSEKEDREKDIQDRCKSTNKAEGMAAGLQAEITGNTTLNIESPFIPSDIRDQSNPGMRSYPFTRTLTPSTTNINVLEIRYQVTNPRTSDPLAELSTEVIPDVSLQCP